MCSRYASVIGLPYSHCYDTMQNDLCLVDNDFLATFPGLGELSQ